MKRTRLAGRAAAWLALLGPVFYATYGVANWWASTRAQVPSVVFDWERSVPFWPWTIFPYWTINVFYALSLFVAPSRHTMDRHAGRLLTATAIAVSCFMAWPLRFSFGQPAVEGLPVLLFDALRSFDQPFNQAPSLHIALAVILWDWYRRLLKTPWARWLADLWALAISASVLTTWQHHFIDVPSGALLGVVCVWLWPLERVVSLPKAWRLTRDPDCWKLASLYGTGGAAVAAIGYSIGGAGFWLAWPAASLALVASNYLGFGARGFRMDRCGRMHWSVWWLFAPYRLGAAVNAWLWTRNLPASVEVSPGLRLGRLPSRLEWERAGRPMLVTLCAELPAPRPARDAGRVRAVPMLDLVIPPTPHLRRAVRMIESAQTHAGPVWVCCALGFSRSAACVIGWLAAHSEKDRGLCAAVEAVRLARPEMVLRPTWRAALDELCRRPAP